MKNYRSLVRRSTFSALLFGVGYASYQINATINILNNTLNIEALDYFEKKTVNFHNDTQYVPQYYGYEKTSTIMERFWGSITFAYARRLLNLAKSDDKNVRLRAVGELSKIHTLDDWQMYELANSCDARTAIGLARTPGVDIRFFAKPPNTFIHPDLANWMKHFMLSLNEACDHPCLEYFIKKQYVSLQEVGRMVEHDITSTEVAQTCLQYKQEPLPVCVDSLLHHSSVGSFGKDIIRMDGLPLLMEVYKKYKDNRDVVVSLIRIISNVSMYPELLPEFYRSGWIGELAKMLRSEDIRISSPAAKTLLNLDVDDQSDGIYRRKVYLLHPAYRGPAKADVDVILVHGLLGGVFYTWRQRDIQNVTEPKYDMNKCPRVEKMATSSDPATRIYLKELEKIQKEEWDEIGCDFEFVLNDLPKSIDAGGLYTMPGEKLCKCNTHLKYTQCWPKDWLVEDCNGLRILGINFDSSLSLWSPMCPTEKLERKTLAYRSEEFLDKLASVGVGKKPIVWLTHSMGGLLVKSMLTQAYESDSDDIKNICNSTKGIVFFSTPHRGTHVASINQTTSLFLWPSVEVRELKEGSPALLKLHQKFLDMLEKIDFKVLSFVETKTTIITPLKLNVQLVKKKSAELNIGEYYEVPLDHLRICKPVNRQSFLYQKVLTFIQNIKNEINQQK